MKVPMWVHVGRWRNVEVQGPLAAPGVPRHIKCTCVACNVPPSCSRTRKRRHNAHNTPKTAQEAKTCAGQPQGGGLTPPIFACMRSQVRTRVLCNATTVITRSQAHLLPPTSASRLGACAHAACHTYTAGGCSTSAGYYRCLMPPNAGQTWWPTCKVQQLQCEESDVGQQQQDMQSCHLGSSPIDLPARK